MTGPDARCTACADAAEAMGGSATARMPAGGHLHYGPDGSVHYQCDGHRTGPFPEECECEAYVRLAGGLTEDRGGSIKGLLSGLSEVKARIVMRKVHAGNDHLPVLVRRVDNCNGLEQQRTGKLRKFNL